MSVVCVLKGWLIVSDLPPVCLATGWVQGLTLTDKGTEWRYHRRENQDLVEESNRIRETWSPTTSSIMSSSVDGLVDKGWMDGRTDGGTGSVCAVHLHNCTVQSVNSQNGWQSTDWHVICTQHNGHGVSISQDLQIAQNEMHNLQTVQWLGVHLAFCSICKYVATKLLT